MGLDAEPPDLESSPACGIRGRIVGRCVSVLFPLRLSLQVAALATVFILLIGVPIAYLLARKRFRGRDLISLILTLPMVLPPVVTGYLLLLLIGRNRVLGKAFHYVTGHQLGILFTWEAAVIASFAPCWPGTSPGRPTPCL